MSYCVLIIILCLAMFSAGAQVRQLIQIKTFDEQLRPLNDVEVSINEKAYISTGNKGTAFIELSEHDLPIQNITIKNNQLEPAAWNFNKNTLEIVVRKKNYKKVTVKVVDTDNIPVVNLLVTYKGKITTNATTNNNGIIEIPLALTESMHDASFFTIKDHTVISLQSTQNEITLTTKKNNPVGIASQPTVKKTDSAGSEVDSSRSPLDLEQLDSAQSLSEFYAILKKYELNNMPPETKMILDNKFSELISNLKDSTLTNDNLYIDYISTSSQVNEDIRNLLNQATTENQTLRNQRIQFDEKINLINHKLERGITELDEHDRATLLSDLIALEKLLTENETRFNRNIEDYREIINTIKERYFNFQQLEIQLSESEAKRIENERIFRQRLIGVSAIVLVFALLIIMLITFSGRLRKQKKELERVNGEIKNINENLETIVHQRTKMLEDTNRELDTFLYRASHDLRSPVSSIIGLCNLAKHNKGNESDKLIELVQLTTSNMDRLLKKLSIISEINQPTHYSSLNLLDMIKNSVNTFTDIIKKQNIELTISCPSDIMFWSYPDLVDAVLTNLIENAIFYSTLKNHKQATVLLSGSKSDNIIQFYVTDNGIGIAESIRNNIFNMFYKGHEDSKGNGLGLYIVQKSVQVLEGSVSIESEYGKYTKVTVQLPLGVAQPTRH